MIASKIFLEVTPFLYTGKGQRVCDVKVYCPDNSDDEVKSALEKAVVDGFAEKDRLTAPGVADQTIYFKKR